jgi:hypothetical protein
MGGTTRDGCDVPPTTRQQQCTAMRGTVNLLLQYAGHNDRDERRQDGQGREHGNARLQRRKRALTHGDHASPIRREQQKQKAVMKQHTQTGSDDHACMHGATQCYVCIPLLLQFASWTAVDASGHARASKQERKQAKRSHVKRRDTATASGGLGGAGGGRSGTRKTTDGRT